MNARSFLCVALFLSALSLRSPAEHDVIGIYLTWERDPATTMTVNWVNLYATGAPTLWYRKLGDTEWISANGTLQAAGPSVLQVRRVELTGLAPDTTYEFVHG